MNAADKAAKLLALARDPGATPGEAAQAARLAQEICTKYGVQPADISQPSTWAARALPGNVSPSWKTPTPTRNNYEQPRGIFRGVPEANLSGISTEDARQMALEILDASYNGRCYLGFNEENLVREAFDGLLTEAGKILLMGLHTIVVG